MKLSYREYLLFAIVAFVIVWLNRNHFFFWDTVQLTSMHAHWFYEQDFSSFFLPQKYDSGHPPFWGLYHAFLWKIFGKSLITSHLAMWPFLFGSLLFAGKIGALLVKNKYAPLFFGLFLLADPVFLTQSTLVSPDIALICFFLMVLYGVLKKPATHINWPIIIGAIGLSMISLRGMMTLAGLGLFVMLDMGFRQGLRKMISFIPGILVGIGFLVIHSFHTKWIGYHAESPWADSFRLVDLKGFARNLIILVWRLLDVGRIFIWILLGFIWYRSKGLWAKEFQGRWFKAFFALSVFLLPTFLLYTGLNGMRYLMPILMIVNLLFVQAIFLLRKQGYHRWLLVFLLAFFAFAMGNTWKYPQEISVSWDTTLLHQPYFSLRKKMLTFIEQEHIPITKIATAFPNTAPLEIIDLNGINERMVAISDTSARYIFVSNIFNDMKNDFNIFDDQMELVKQFQDGVVWVKLYRIPLP